MAAQQTPDYLAIGHVTVDRNPNGSVSLGGTALYAALTAARFGLRAAILTRGNFTQHGPEITEALARYAAEIDIIVQAAAAPTVFTNVIVAGRRQQTVHSWAGPIDLTGLPPAWRSAGVIHLAPVAQEIDARQAGRLSPDYFGATPQGWMRQWQTSRQHRVSLQPLRLPDEILGRLDAIVVNSEEHTLARDALNTVGARGIAVVTRGAEGAQVVDRGRVIDVPAYPVPTVEDIGAGDVFAATLFLLRAEHEPTTVAARMAAAAAALRVQGHGPDAVPTREAVQEFLARAERRPARPRRR